MGNRAEVLAKIKKGVEIEWNNPTDTATGKMER